MPPPLQAARAGRTQCKCCGVPCVGRCSPESNPSLLQEKDQILELLMDFFLLFFHFLSSIFFFYFIFGEGYLRSFTKPAFSAVAGVLFVSHTTCSRQKSLLGHSGKESCANPNPIPSLVPWEPLSRGQGTIPAGGWECWECLIPQDS